MIRRSFLATLAATSATPVLAQKPAAQALLRRAGRHGTAAGAVGLWSGLAGRAQGYGPRANPPIAFPGRQKTMEACALAGRPIDVG